MLRFAAMNDAHRSPSPRFPTRWFFSARTGAILCLLTILFAIPLRAARAQSAFTGQAVRVLRGDEIVVRLDSWELTVRLHGIAAPDHPAALATRAREYVVQRLGSAPVHVKVLGTAPGQTVYGEVTPADAPVSLNLELAAVGLARWAKAYAPGRKDIAVQERAARVGKRGLWGDQQGADIPLPNPPPRSVSAPQATPAAPEDPYAALPQSPPSESRRLMSRALPPPPALRPLPMPDHAWRRTEIGVLSRAASDGQGSMEPPSPSETQERMLVGFASGMAALASWAFALRLTRREQILRAATPQSSLAPALGNEAGSAARPPDAFARFTGRAQALSAPPQSEVGRIEGIFVRETTRQYLAAAPDANAAFGTGRREPRLAARAAGATAAGYRWHTVVRETQSADFALEDADGNLAVVEATRAQFHPLRIARFYNDVPVESWFERAYPGDTRTEVEYIPLRAEVTVWGRLSHDLPSPEIGRYGPRIAFDSDLRCLEITEGDGSRLFSRTRPLAGIGLTLAGILFAGFSAAVFLCPGLLSHG